MPGSSMILWWLGLIIPRTKIRRSSAAWWKPVQRSSLWASSDIRWRMCTFSSSRSKGAEMINFDRVRTMIQKEWAEMFKNRVLLFTVVLMPVLFTALPIIMLSVMGSSTTTSAASASDIPAQFARTCGNMNASDCMQVYLVNEFLLLYLIMPVMIPITIAAYSIVGEKATHSLEPLLATPITTEELLLGKGLAAV